MKSNNVSIGCYVWLLPTRMLANRDCLLKLYKLNHLEQFLVSFTWKNVSTLGLLHTVS